MSNHERQVKMQVTNYENSIQFLNKNKYIGRASLIVTPLFFFLSEIFHPRSETDTVKELMAVAENYTEWYMAHLFALIAIVFIPFAVLNLMRYIDNRNIAIGHMGYVFSILGVIGVSGYTAFDLIVWQIGIHPNQEVMVSLYDQITQSLGFSLPFLMVGPLFLVLGIAMIAIALYCSQIIKKWKALLIFIGILLYGLTGPLIAIENGHLIVIFGAGLMLIGLGSIFFQKQ